MKTTAATTAARDNNNHNNIMRQEQQVERDLDILVQRCELERCCATIVLGIKVTVWAML